MCVREFLDLCFNDEDLYVSVYDFTTFMVVYRGSKDDVPTEYLEAKLESWDVPDEVNHIEVNIETME